MRSNEANLPVSVNKLKHDIMNSINHVLSHHSKYSADFCKVAQGAASHVVSVASNNSGDENDDEDGDVLEESLLHWTEGTKDDELDEARGPSQDANPEIDEEVSGQVKRLLTQLADKADNLICNFMTNMAEEWMTIQMKLDSGKVINRCSRRSWHARCFGGGLRMNYGIEWSPKGWQL